MAFQRMCLGLIWSTAYENGENPTQAIIFKIFMHFFLFVCFSLQLISLCGNSVASSKLRHWKYCKFWTKFPWKIRANAQTKKRGPYSNLISCVFSSYFQYFFLLFDFLITWNANRAFECVCALINTTNDYLTIGLVVCMYFSVGKWKCKRIWKKLDVKKENRRMEQGSLRLVVLSSSYWVSAFSIRGELKPLVLGPCTVCRLNYRIEPYVNRYDALNLPKQLPSTKQQQVVPTQIGNTTTEAMIRRW